MDRLLPLFPRQHPPPRPSCQPATVTQKPPTPVEGWICSNPGGGGAFASIGAGSTGIILAGSDLSGAYISKDRGESWNPIGFVNGLTTTHVVSVGLDSQDENILDLDFAPSNPSVGYAAWHSEWFPMANFR